MTTELTARLAGLRPDGPDEMGRELAEGPAAVEATLAVVERLEPELEEAHRRAGRLLLVGTGASLAMARAAAPLFRVTETAAEAAGGRPRPVVVLEASSVVLAPMGEERFAPGDLAVVVSQSGASPETLAAARRARAAGATVLAITADPGSPLAAAGELVVHTPSGPEAGAATKSEVAALAALAALAGALPPGRAAAGRLRSSLEAIVADLAPVVPGGLALARATHAWAIGFGSAAGLAQGATLLLHEKALLVTVPGTPSEFRHGPIEAAGRGDVVLLIDTDPPDPRRAAYLALLASELDRVEVPLVVLGRDVLPGTGPRTGLVIPLDEPGAAGADRTDRGAAATATGLLQATLRIQQLARLAAHARGTYRDGFRVLRAVVGAALELD